MTIKIWGRKTSINVQKVLWVCAELELAFDRSDTGGEFGGLDSPEYLSLNPNGLIPTLQDEDTVIWESNAIVRYLAARYGAGDLWPADPAARAHADMWMDWTLTTFWPPVRVLFIQLVRTKRGERNDAQIAAARETSAKLMSVLNEALKDRSYLSGSTLTMADIAVGVVAHRWYRMDLERPEFGHAQAWFERLAERQAFKETVDLPLG